MSQEPPPPPPPPPGQPYPPSQPYTTPPRAKSKALWIILAVVLGVIILCCALGGIIALAVDDSDEDGKRKVLGSDAASADGSSSDTTAPSETPTTEPPADEGEPQDFRVESGFTSGTDSIGTHYVSAGARITNPNPSLAAYDVQVLFNLVAANGDVLDSTTETVGYIAGGETVPVAPLQIGFEVKKKAAELQVQVVGEFTEDEGPKDSFGGETTILKFKGAEIVESSYSTELSGQVSNPTDAVVTEASWDCIYLNGNKIVGGASSAIIDPIPPGSTVQFSEYLSLENIPVKSVDCRIVSGY